MIDNHNICSRRCQSRQAWQRRWTRALLWLLGLAVLAAGAGCQDAPPEAEMEVETAEPTGETIPSPDEIIITRVVQQQITNVVATPDTSQDLVTLDVTLIGDDITTLDPQISEGSNERDLVENLFVGLTRLNQVTGEIEPMIAQSWDISPDGLVWTFHLREDMYWIRPVPSSSSIFQSVEPQLKESQAFRPIIADDFVFSIRRACLSQTDAPNAFILFMIEGCERIYRQSEVSGNDLAEIGIRAVDLFTLEITLNRPASYFLTITALPIMRPVPAEIVFEARNAGDWAWPADGDEVISNGPFVLDPQSIRGTKIVLRRNPFWPLPMAGNIEIVNFFQFSDFREAFNLWEKRNLDIAPLANSMQADVLSRIPQKVQLVPEQAVFYLAFNMDSAVFRHVELRRAFAAAIDRQEIIDEVYAGRGLPMRHLTPPGVFGAPPIDQLGVGYDPDFARLSLVAGPTTACRFLPEIRYMVNSSDSDLFQAEMVRDMWVDVLGCDPEQIMIEQVQFGTLLASTRPQAGDLRPDVWDLGWASYYPDANNWLYDILHCTSSDNRVNRPCSEVDDQLERAARAEPALRVQLYRRLETDFFGPDGITPIVPIYTRARYRLRQTWVNFIPNSFGGEQYDTYQLDWELKKIEKQQ